MDYRSLYEWGREQLAAGQIEENELDARLLLEAVCQTARHDLLVNGARLVTVAQEAAYVDYIAQRRTRKPLQYILGEQEFMGLRFAVTPQVLIPRQDTEVLAEEVLRFCHDGQSVLDMCTGSGCILLSVLKYTNACRGTGADISAAALAVAADNAARLGLEAVWLESDLFSAVTGRYDIIVANPPYIPTAVIAGLMAEVRDYEPVGALDGDADGLFFYRQLTARAGAYLEPEGRLFLEIGAGQAEAVSGMMTAAGFRAVTAVKDLAGIDRVIWGALQGKGQ